ncbi:hypothetical protein Y1Q_0012663 [Alligator mississippiensis]|uniref:Uncharacterized protein n=1 Tax=Alligator mississippiensis TaxID=8496 RepID=A0A151M8H2_ALLMI|nr:hypothetical protein Y1Q_0012663 [Alligator mississippiensis]
MGWMLLQAEKMPKHLGGENTCFYLMLLDGGFDRKEKVPSVEKGREREAFPTPKFGSIHAIVTATPAQEVGHQKY